MSGNHTCDSTMPEAQLGFKRRAVNLWLPLSPTLELEPDFEEFDADDLFIQPCTGSSFGTDFPSPFCVSRFSDDSEVEDAPYSVTRDDEFEEWDGFATDDAAHMGAEVTIESDGSQLIHIPHDSPFYHPISPPHSLPTPFFQHDSSSDTASSSSSSSATTTPPGAFRQAEFDDCFGPRIVNIANTSRAEQHGNQRDDANDTPEIMMPALSASCYFPETLNSYHKASHLWKQERDTHLDVPCSAISIGDDWEERKDGLGALARRQLIVGC